ncbi:outer membrane protein assembly factor BamE [Luteithermobacter gelatinilyticus]|uniref:outer membrane protein assembly factor BamE n=1 Tax=Luteithermobacter gelatinilyticus TaxID=2582913 RepID=UPI001106D908|nr:outer membrane protein assembly factor BamE [Luteithermobacter gelatinilyticus]|tara:strand:+ start:6516 stop:6980 length:465 start_codon:yes stop_codon:yes gene_type:complete
MTLSKKTFFLLTLVILAIGACSPRKYVRGYMADETMVSAIRPQVDTQDSVQSMLGSPTATSTFDNLNWYYYTKRSEQLAFFSEDITELDIIAIRFNEDGYVTKVDRYTLEDLQEVAMSGDKTKTYGKELGFFKELFGNIGRFGAGNPSTPQAGN